MLVIPVISRWFQTEAVTELNAHFYTCAHTLSSLLFFDQFIVKNANDNNHDNDNNDGDNDDGDNNISDVQQ